MTAVLSEKELANGGFEITVRIEFLLDLHSCHFLLDLCYLLFIELAPRNTWGTIIRPSVVCWCRESRLIIAQKRKRGRRRKSKSLTFDSGWLLRSFPQSGPNVVPSMNVAGGERLKLFSRPLRPTALMLFFKDVAYGDDLATKIG